MKKAEVEELLKQKAKKGYITHSMLLDLWNDGDEIDEKYISLFWSKPQKPQPYIIYGSQAMHDALEEAFKDYADENSK